MVPLLTITLTQAPCPLSGDDTPALQRWMLAQAIVRSRAYIVLDDGVEVRL